MYKYVLTQIIFLFICVNTYAITIEFDDNELESILETIARNSNQSEVINQIESLINNPIELSSSSIEQIAQIPTITYPLAREIKSLVKSGKNLYQIIDSLKLTKETAYLLHYCSYIDRSQKKQVKSSQFQILSRSRAIEQLNILKGFESNKFKGSRTDLYQRFLIKYENLSGGVLFSKDLGELYKNSFYSGFIGGSFNSFSFVAGDFYIKSGLGSILWTPYSMGKGADVIGSAFQFDNSVYSYKSSSEFGFFRGLSLSNRFNLSQGTDIELSVWASYAPRSATVTDSGTITSLDKTGLFRTESEISKQNSVFEKSVGGNLTLSHNGLNFGVSAFHLDYGMPVHSSAAAVISGREALLSTAYVMIPSNYLSFAAEASSDGHRNMAYKLIAEYQSRKFIMLVHGRSFSAGFRSPFGYMFGEQNNPSNEYGIYTGFLYKGFKNIEIASYVDYYGSYTETFYVPKPIHGLDIFNQTTFNLGNKNEVSIRLQYENKTDAKTINSSGKAVYQRSKYYTRLDYIFYPAERLRLRLRADFNFINFQTILPNETGLAAYIEGEYEFLDKISLTGRFAYFSTDSYASAIWQYECSIPGYLYMPPLYGVGFRTYVLINWEVLNNLNLRIRYVLMKKNNVDNLGSGYNEILGDTDHRLYLQLDFKL